MTSKQYQKAVAALVRRFNPATDKLQFVTRADGTLSKVPQDHEWTFASGVRIHAFFSHRMPHSKRVCADWIAIGLPTVNDAYKRVTDHWKWNIHFSGERDAVRGASLDELKRRLEKLREVFS